MLWVAMLFALGIALGHALHIGLWLSMIAGAALIVVSVARNSVAGYLLPLLFLPLGNVCYQIEKGRVSDDRVKLLYTRGAITSHDPVEVEGVLLAPPEPAYRGLFFNLRVERIKHRNTEHAASGKVRLFADTQTQAVADEYDRLDLRYGSRVRVSCRLEREDRYLNPGVASRIEVLDQQGIDAVATIKSPRLIEKLGEESVFVPLAWVYAQRQRLIAAFRTRLSDQTSGVMIASLLGDKHFLDRDTAEVFREGGTFHVLVISGLHITFIGGLTLWFVSLFTRRTNLQALLASIFLWAYTLAVGAEIPVVRASVMFSILILSRVINREGSLLNALGTCTLLLLVWRPDELLSASFQLTFVSVVAIVGCAFPVIEKLRAIGSWTPSTDAPLPPAVPSFVRRFCELLYWNAEAWRIDNARQIWSANLFKSPYLARLRGPNAKSFVAYIVEGILVSFIVQIWMLPLLAIYFHRVSPTSIVLNLWVGVFLALESFSALIAVLLGGISTWFADPLISVTEALNVAMMLLPSWFSEFDFSSSRLPVYSGQWASVYWVYAASVARTAVALFAWDPFEWSYRRRFKRAGIIIPGALTLVLGFIIVFHPFSSPRPDGRLRADFLDVGQGDSALLTFPNGTTMLVDGGGSMNFHRSEAVYAFEPDAPRIGEFVVSEFLWQKGYSRIDFVLATHADSDHMQGLVDVVRNFEIGTVLLSLSAVSDPRYEQLIAACRRREIPIGLIGRGDMLELGGALVEVLSPARKDAPNIRSANNASVVMRVKFGSRSILLTGDIERETEAEMLADPATVRSLRADITKVPHHGSRTSSTPEFIEKTAAGIAIISVGRRSPFGHPHLAVVHRWQGSGSKVMTTGAKGTITISTDGSDLRIETFVP